MVGKVYSTNNYYTTPSTGKLTKVKGGIILFFIWQNSICMNRKKTALIHVKIISNILFYLVQIHTYAYYALSQVGQDMRYKSLLNQALIK